MGRLLALSICLAAGTVATPSLYAADKDEPKKTPPSVSELLKATPEEFIKRFDKNKDGHLSKDELPPRLAQAFDKADTNGDGKLDRKEVAEMLKVLRQRAGVETKAAAPETKTPATNPELERFVTAQLERLDTNKDGKISKAEARGPLADNFDRLDENKDGFLDRDELRKAAARFIAQRGALGGAGPNTPDFDALDRDADGRLTREELKGTSLADKFDQIDTNKDGKIDRKEFTAYFKKLAEKKAP